MSKLLLITLILRQAIWLSTAYKLEFRGEPVYFPLWVASIGFLLVNGWILVEILAAYEKEVPTKGTSRAEEQGVSTRPDVPAITPSIDPSVTSSGTPTDKSEAPWQTPKKRRKKRSGNGPASPSSPTSPVPASPKDAVEDASNGMKWKHASKVAD